ncbi:MAG: molybdopterin biosynthesis protein [Anaerolineaceae bacterium]|nr:molybdopterin biosynthesis protein [Anaerolineaceae bacterium]
MPPRYTAAMEERNVYLEDIPAEQARARLESALRAVGRDGPLPGERVPLAEAGGRVTAEAVYARLSAPHYHAAAMDGYAVAAAMTRGATETRPLTLAVPEEARPVNTGDPLPADRDAVIMIEHTQELDEGRIAIRSAVAPWQHLRPMGEDMVASELVLPPNHLLRPVDLGALAGCGHDSALVRRRPRVLILPTGSELVAPGVEPAPGQVIESNSLVLAAQVRDAGGEAFVLESAADEPLAIRAALLAALTQEPDLILLLSGSSAGSRDYSAAVLRAEGELLVHGVAVRPGHPVIMGMLRGLPVIGVPGYPVSAALTGELFVTPLLRQWLGLGDLPRDEVQAIMTRKLVSPTGDDDYVRVTLAQVDGRLLASPLGQGAGVISSLLRADGLALVPRFSEGLNRGAQATVQLLRPLAEVRRSLLAQGSHDPLLDLLAQWLAERGQRLVSANVGSLGGLAALRRAESHLAGTHLLDEASGEYNVAALRQWLPQEALRLVTFAHREQGLIVQRGNPLSVRGLQDLPRLRFINRQRGSGTRALLDYELKRLGIAGADIEGHDREVYTHLAVAAAVASGVADCGLGLRRAAQVLELDFVPVGEERFDLCIPERHLALAGMQALLETLADSRFRAALGREPGYDSRETGQEVLRQ